MTYGAVVESPEVLGAAGGDLVLTADAASSAGEAVPGRAQEISKR